MADAAPELDELESTPQNPDQDDNPDKPQLSEKEEIMANRDKLSDRDFHRVERKETTPKKIVQEQLLLRKQAEENLGKFLRDQQIDEKDFKEYRDKFEQTKDVQDLQKMVDDMPSLPREVERRREEEAKDTKAKERVLKPDDKRLMDIEKKIFADIDKNEHLIGTKQIAGFKKWFEQERQKKPTLANMEDLQSRFNGDKNDRGGLAPRQKVFTELEELFQEYGLGSPLKSEYIKAEGLTERETVLKNAKTLKGQFDQYKGNNLHTPRVIKNAMQKGLMAKPLEQQLMLAKLDTLTRDEMKALSFENKQVNVNGVTIKMMSKASWDFIWNDQRGRDIDDQFRQNPSMRLEKLMDNEVGLAKELAEIYKDHPELFKDAIGEFQHLKFEDKQKALIDHKKLVEHAEGAEDLEKKLLVKNAHTAIDRAGQSKIFSKKTVARYKKFFENEQLYSDPKTGRVDLKKLRKFYDALISPTPDPGARNIAAYEQKRDQFKDKLDRFAEISPNIKKEDIASRQAKFDAEGWNRRDEISKKFDDELAKAEREFKKKKAEERELHITDKEKSEAKSENMKRSELILTVSEAIKEETPESVGHGLKTLRLFMVNNPEYDTDQFLIDLENELVALKRKVGIKAPVAKSVLKDFETEAKDLIDNDYETKRKMEELQRETFATNLARQSTQRLQREYAADKSEKEAIAHTAAGSEERQVTEQFLERAKTESVGEHKQTTLDAAGKAADIVYVRFDEHGEKEEDILRLKKKLRGESLNYFNRKGSTQVKLKHKERELTYKEAQIKNKEDIAKMEEAIAEKAEDRVAEKSGKSGGAEIFDLNARVAARRKAKDLVKEKIKAEEVARTLRQQVAN
ncbi:MAG: hypothetical protein WC873_01850 [Candidatus Gracilibacteria bacterium]